jgi:hypothetical protein
MQLPSYWLPRPAMQLDQTTQAAFDQLLTTALVQGTGPLLDYTLAAPKWQFLCYLAEHRAIALHGSGSPDITQFTPRQPIDSTEFGSQCAVYAADDGIWALFFAIADRARYPMSLLNSCIRIAQAPAPLGEPLYVFSVSRTALPQQPWRDGMVYLLPRATFIAQPAVQVDTSTIHPAQLASLVPVTPLARLAVTPADFPFLAQIRGHDDARLADYAAAMDTGAPWPDSTP